MDNTIIAVIITGIFSIVVGFLGNLFLQTWQRKKDNKHLTAIFAGDIFAILSIIADRKYEKGLHDALATIRGYIQRQKALDEMKDKEQRQKALDEMNVNEPREKFERAIFRRPIQGDYLMVYKQNVGKLGVLKSSLAAKIVIFYTDITMLLDDNREVVEIDKNTAELSYIALRHEETLDLLEKTVKRGKEVLNDLNPEFLEMLKTSNKSIDETHPTQSELTEGDGTGKSQN